MAQIDASEIITALIKGLKLNPAREEIPSELADKILPVFSIKPERLIFPETTSASDATSATIFTTSSVKDTFLVGAQISVNKSVVNDGTSSQVNITIFGAAVESVILRTFYEPVTAASHLYANINLSIPIKLARGTNIRILNQSGLASIDTAATVFLYETEPQ